MRFLVHAHIVLLLVCGALSARSDRDRKEMFHEMVKRDMQEIPKSLQDWMEGQKISLKHFRDALTKHKPEEISEKLRKISKFIQKPSNYGLQPEHAWKNSHKGCVPYDETRTLKNIPGFFFSSSDVLTPEQEYIVSQAPAKDTLIDFWRVIIESKVRTIVALVTPKSFAYWGKEHFPMKLDGWTISCAREELVGQSPFLLHHKIVRRVFTLSNWKEKRVVAHYHYENWPDHGAPELVLFHTLLDLVDQWNPEGSSPIFVHCAAGIGRSGTFVAAHSLRKEIRSGKVHSVNVARRIFEMRIQRGKMLSKPEQIQAVYVSIFEGLAA